MAGLAMLLATESVGLVVFLFFMLLAAAFWLLLLEVPFLFVCCGLPWLPMAAEAVAAATIVAAADDDGVASLCRFAG